MTKARETIQTNTLSLFATKLNDFSLSSQYEENQSKNDMNIRDS